MRSASRLIETRVSVPPPGHKLVSHDCASKMPSRKLSDSSIVNALPAAPVPENRREFGHYAGLTL